MLGPSAQNSNKCKRKIPLPALGLPPLNYLTRFRRPIPKI